MKKTLIAFVVISSTLYLNANTVAKEAKHEPSDKLKLKQNQEFLN